MAKVFETSTVVPGLLDPYDQTSVEWYNEQQRLWDETTQGFHVERTSKKLGLEQYRIAGTPWTRLSFKGWIE